MRLGGTLECVNMNFASVKALINGLCATRSTLFPPPCPVFFFKSVLNIQMQCISFLCVDAVVQGCALFAQKELNIRRKNIGPPTLWISFLCGVSGL